MNATACSTSVSNYRESLINYLTRINKIRKESIPFYTLWDTEKLKVQVAMVQEEIEKKYPPLMSREEATKDWPLDWLHRDEHGDHDSSDLC